MPSVCPLPLPVQVRFARVLIGLRPRWLQHIGNHKVLEDDQVFLHWQERVLEAAGGSAEANALSTCRPLQTVTWPLCIAG